MDLNKVMLIGRLTRDPELRTTTTGKSVASMAVATGRVWTDQAGTKQEKLNLAIASCGESWRHCPSISSQGTSRLCGRATGNSRLRVPMASSDTVPRYCREFDYADPRSRSVSSQSTSQREVREGPSRSSVQWKKK